jgi:hypothetical protein
VFLSTLRIVKTRAAARAFHTLAAIVVLQVFQTGGSGSGKAT